jgi:hypothetical protein
MMNRSWPRGTLTHRDLQQQVDQPGVRRMHAKGGAVPMRRAARASSSLVFAVVIATGACAPVFSELQGARLVGPHKVELTPSASTVYFSDSGGSDHLQDHVGLQVATGVSPKVDLRFRYEHVIGGVNVFGLGPKLQLVKDRVAFYAPVGFAIGGGIETSKTWELQPTLLFTQPATSTVDLNLSAKYLIPLHGGGDGLVALNVGLGLGPESKKWAFWPEVGWLFDPGNSGHFTQASLGFSFRP